MSVAPNSASDKLMELVDRGVSLPALPSIGAELLSVTRMPSESVEIGQIAQIIDKDPSLSARILRTANSPFYGVVRKITSIHHAITIIGLDDTMGFLNFYLVKNMMPEDVTLPNFSTEQFWLHSWATATAGRLLGRPQFLVRSSPGELYLAGLLHDIGKILMAIHLPEEFSAAIELASQRVIPLHVAEQEVIGVDHATLGAHMLDGWNLPPSILDAVACHHDPEQAPEEHRELAALTQFADLTINRCEVGVSGTPYEVINLDSSWLIQNSLGPLTREETRRKLLLEITETLQSKFDAADGPTAEPEDDENAGEEITQSTELVPDPEPAPWPATVSPPKKQGFWVKMTEAIRWLFE